MNRCIYLLFSLALIIPTTPLNAMNDNQQPVPIVSPIPTKKGVSKFKKKITQAQLDAYTTNAPSIEEKNTPEKEISIREFIAQNLASNDEEILLKTLSFLKEKVETQDQEIINFCIPVLEQTHNTYQNRSLDLATTILSIVQQQKQISNIPSNNELSETEIANIITYLRQTEIDVAHTNAQKEYISKAITDLFNYYTNKNTKIRIAALRVALSLVTYNHRGENNAHFKTITNIVQLTLTQVKNIFVANQAVLVLAELIKKQYEEAISIGIDYYSLIEQRLTGKQLNYIAHVNIEINAKNYTNYFMDENHELYTWRSLHKAIHKILPNHCIGR